MWEPKAQFCSEEHRCWKKHYLQFNTGLNGSFHPFDGNKLTVKTCKTKKESINYPSKQNFSICHIFIEQIHSKLKMAEKRNKVAENSSDCVSTTDDEERWRERPRKAEDLPSEYWSIQKLIRYTKSGNVVATNACLCCLRDYDLTLQTNQRAILKTNGLETLVNLIDSNDLVCSIGSLYVLKELTTNIDMRQYIIDLNAIELLLKLVDAPVLDTKKLAIDVLANLARVRIARSKIRKTGAIPKIVNLLEVNGNHLEKPLEELSVNEHHQLELTISVAQAIAVILRSERNLKIAKRYGLIHNIGCVLKTIHLPLISAVLMICRLSCSFNSDFRLAVETEQLIPDIVNKLNLDDENILTEACDIIFKCGARKEFANSMELLNGISIIFNILSNEDKWNNDKLILAATSAAFTCAMHDSILKQIDDLKVMPILIKMMMTDFNDDILTSICNCVAQLIKIEENLSIFGLDEPFEKTVEFIRFVYDPLSIAASLILEQCLKNPQYAEKFNQMNAVKTLWSLLKNNNGKVRFGASKALREYIKNDVNSAEVVRSLVNGLERIVRLLHSDDEQTLTAACSLIAEIGKNEYNLAILTDYQVIPLLSKLADTTNEQLQITLGLAIASCAPYKDNAQMFGELRVMRSIVKYMTSENLAVRRSGAMALEQLSRNASNCVTMHQNNVVPFLLEGVQSTDKLLQNASANCLYNLRALALEAEKTFMM